ncbi:cell wall hydrolase [Bacillus cereus group sp. MYBK234-1]|uniref:cell wall hydrolase n=1 Tax=unclassified Bacillus cereus group TaxID=2750818 RepID=UPI003F790D36
MPVIKVTDTDISLLARLIRAEAEGEGNQGMLLVGNVGINRIRSNCSDFKNINSIREMIYQKHGFEAITHGYFYQKARESDMNLARQVINGAKFWPATFSLWYFKPSGICPPQWYNQPLAGRYKNHCFFQPNPSTCEQTYNTF